MVDWHRFTPSNFEYDFEGDKLFKHRVTFNEAVECFFSDFEIRRNKKYRDRYQLIGSTLGGRRLKIIFQVKANRVVRIITGWPL
ncbi:MAG: BrnT family toxin [Acidobacteria bacterium]|nr:BrnT family toxin [Acidobacteriota bacterium]